MEQATEKLQNERQATHNGHRIPPWKVPYLENNTNFNNNNNNNNNNRSLCVLSIIILIPTKIKIKVRVRTSSSSIGTNQVLSVVIYKYIFCTRCFGVVVVFFFVLFFCLLAKSQNTSTLNWPVTKLLKIKTARKLTLTVCSHFYETF